MANKGGFFSSAFYIFMSVMAMNFVLLCIILIGLYAFGFYTKEDLNNVALVLVGNRKYALTKDQIQEYNRLREEDETRRKEITSAKGSDNTRDLSAKALDDMRKQLAEQIRDLSETRAQHTQRLADLRANIEKLKKDYIRERDNLKAFKAESTKVELTKRHETMMKTLRQMDPELIAKLFEGNMQQPDGAEENSRIIRQFLTPDITAEVMAVVPDKYMRQIVPLIENKYAGMSPQMIVKAWTTPGTSEYKTPEQMAQYMRNMTVTQAFTIFTLLDAKNRAELVRLLKAPLGNDGQ